MRTNDIAEAARALVTAMPTEDKVPADDRVGRIAAILSNAWLWVAIGTATMVGLST